MGFNLSSAVLSLSLLLSMQYVASISPTPVLYDISHCSAPNDNTDNDLSYQVILLCFYHLKYKTTPDEVPSILTVSCQLLNLEIFSTFT